MPSSTLLCHMEPIFLYDVLLRFSKCGSALTSLILNLLSGPTENLTLDSKMRQCLLNFILSSEQREPLEILLML